MTPKSKETVSKALKQFIEVENVLIKLIKSDSVRHHQLKVLAIKMSDGIKEIKSVILSNDLDKNCPK